MSQLLDRCLDSFDGAFSTVNNYRSLRRESHRVIHRLRSVGVLDASIFVSLYAELRRCRSHCTGLFIEHRTGRVYECNARYRPHKCKPLGRSGIRQMLWMPSIAFRSATRWTWVGVNSVSNAEPGRPPQTNPQPPTAREAARIIAAAAE